MRGREEIGQVERTAVALVDFCTTETHIQCRTGRSTTYSIQLDDGSLLHVTLHDLINVILTLAHHVGVMVGLNKTPWCAWIIDVGIPE